MMEISNDTAYLIGVVIAVVKALEVGAKKVFSSDSSKEVLTLVRDIRDRLIRLEAQKD